MLQSKLTAYGPGYYINDSSCTDVCVPVKGTPYGGLAGTLPSLVHPDRRQETGVFLDCGTADHAARVICLINENAPVARVLAQAELGRQVREQAERERRRKRFEVNSVRSRMLTKHRFDWRTLLIRGDALEEKGFYQEAEADRAAGRQLCRQCGGFILRPGAVVVNHDCYHVFGSGFVGHYSHILTPDGQELSLSQAEQAGLIGRGVVIDPGHSGFWGCTYQEIWPLVANLRVCEHHWADPGPNDHPVTSPLGEPVLSTNG
jgi:hypothetical protein